MRYILKEITDCILPLLTILSNLSFSASIISDLLKVAKVVHIKGGIRLTGNYRHISLLTIFEKILEQETHFPPHLICVTTLPC